MLVKLLAPTTCPDKFILQIENYEQHTAHEHWHARPLIQQVSEEKHNVRMRVNNLCMHASYRRTKCQQHLNTFHIFHASCDPLKAPLTQLPAELADLVQVQLSGRHPKDSWHSWVSEDSTASDDMHATAGGAGMAPVI